MSDNLTQDHVTTEPEQDVEGSQESLEPRTRRSANRCSQHERARLGSRR